MYVLSVDNSAQSRHSNSATPSPFTTMAQNTINRLLDEKAADAQVFSNNQSNNNS